MEIRNDAETSSYTSLFAAISYGIASMAMVFINKAVLMQYSHSMTLLTLQTLGFVLLGGVQVHALNVTGLVINTAGGVWYSYAKYQQKRSKTVKQITDLEAHRK